MNRIFKDIPAKVGLAGSCAAIVLTLALPLSSAAEVMTPPHTQPIPVGSVKNGFCTALSNKESTITGKLSDLKNKVSDSWTQQDQKLTSLASQTDQKIAEARTQADSQRQSNFAKLEAKATTDSQKAAVTTYETAVNAAVTARRAAYDSARQTFRNGVKSLVDSHRSQVSSQADTFQSAVNDAFSTAMSSCTSGTSAGDVHQTLVNALKTARENFQNDRKSDSKVGDQVKQLAATRDAAFKTANQAFQASLKSAADALKAAFGSDSSKV